MASIRLSAGVKAAWQIGADLALDTGSPCIEPMHILYGLLSLRRFVEEGSPDNEFDLAKIRDEALEISEILTQFDIAVLEQDIRAASPAADRDNRSGRAMSRSAKTRAIFGEAEAIAEKSGSAEVGARELVQALVRSGDAGIGKQLADANMDAVIGENRERRRSPQTLPHDGPKAVLASAIDEVLVTQSLDASVRVPARGASEKVDRLSALCELTWEFGAQSPIEPVLQTVCEQLLRTVPSAEHASVLLADKHSNELLLKAHAPGVAHRISLTCARQAAEQSRTILWHRGQHLTASQRASDAVWGIYAPLLADGKTVGVICLDSASNDAQFADDDLFFVTVLAHQLALAITNRNLQLTLQRNAEVLQRLLTNFSPKIRKRLLERAERGRLRLGGERSEVSILCSDIRGFTRLSSNMEAEDVVALLNDYFSDLTECIFRNDGTIDKFVGDAILAVFGSPEPDPKHRQKAVKAAIEMQQAMERVSQRRKQKLEPVCAIGIGVHAGEVLHGFIGSVDRMEYTVIGDPVNKAARYCDGAKSGEVIISPEVHEHVWRMVVASKALIPTKHEGDLVAHRVESLRPGFPEG